MHDSYLLLFICFDVFIIPLEQTGGTFESILFFLGKQRNTKLEDDKVGLSPLHWSGTEHCVQCVQ